MTPIESIALGISEANCGAGENPRDWLKYYLPDAVKALEGLARVDEQGITICFEAIANAADRHVVEFSTLHAAFLDILAEIAKGGEK